jgi:Zn-finger nucleic acid-binding protein
MRLKEDAVCLTCDYCGSVQVPEPNSDGVRVLDVPAGEFCPVCTAPLVHAVVAGHRMRYCQKCHGMLIAMELFPVIVEDLRARREITFTAAYRPDPKDLDRRIRCPQCGVEMDTHPYMGPGNIIIDSCEHCALDWLDYGELDRVVRAPDRQYSVD